MKELSKGARRGWWSEGLLLKRESAPYEWINVFSNAAFPIAAVWAGDLVFIILASALCVASAGYHAYKVDPWPTLDVAAMGAAFGYLATGFSDALAIRLGGAAVLAVVFYLVKEKRPKELSMLVALSAVAVMIVAATLWVAVAFVAAGVFFAYERNVSKDIRAGRALWAPDQAIAYTGHGLYHIFAAVAMGLAV